MVLKLIKYVWKTLIVLHGLGNNRKFMFVEMVVKTNSRGHIHDVKKRCDGSLYILVGGTFNSTWSGLHIDRSEICLIRDCKEIIIRSGHIDSLQLDQFLHKKDSFSKNRPVDVNRRNRILRWYDLKYNLVVFRPNKKIDLFAKIRPGQILFSPTRRRKLSTFYFCEIHMKEHERILAMNYFWVSTAPFLQ